MGGVTPDGGSKEQESSEVEEEEAGGQVRDVVMTKTETATTAVIETEAGLLTSNH
jgi:hypothetical protein